MMERILKNYQKRQLTCMDIHDWGIIKAIHLLLGTTGHKKMLKLKL